MSSNSNPKIQITISYGYDIHSLELSSNHYDKIKEGETLDIKGQGFFIEGEVVQDTWHFNAGKLDVICENGFDVFHGTLGDIIHIDQTY